MDQLKVSDYVLEFENDTISVTQLNKLAKTLLENNMPVFWIKGEVSGLRTYSHAYFDLKDDGGKVTCVLFAKTLAMQDFQIENGQQVEVRGKVSVYSPSGSYQINVERVRKVGMGELWEAYQRLLNKLKHDGLFDPIHKKPLPIFPKSIGVITSREGSVIRDVITTLKRRMPNIQIIVYHTLVQGRDASMQIAKAIKVANRRNETDVLIVCRGGGSQEDLWCFNEEVVAREVFLSHIPLISAIGHETDNTIIDFVSDLRAPTPTSAAELVSKSMGNWLNSINKLKITLDNELNSIVNNKKQQLDLYYAKLKLLNPINQLREKYTVVDSIQMRLIKVIKQLLKDKYLHLTHLERQLGLVNPNNILSRGYAIVRNEKGNVVYNAEEVFHNENIEVILSHGSINAIVVN